MAGLVGSIKKRWHVVLGVAIMGAGVSVALGSLLGLPPHGETAKDAVMIIGRNLVVGGCVVYWGWVCTRSIEVALFAAGFWLFLGAFAIIVAGTLLRPPASVGFVAFCVLACVVALIGIALMVRGGRAIKRKRAGNSHEQH